MADAKPLDQMSPEELLAHAKELADANTKLARQNQSLGDKLRTTAAPGEVTQLRRDNDLLRAKLQEAAAQAGPERGTHVRYFKVGEASSRPAVVVSRGFVERVRKGNLLVPFAVIEYGDPEGYCDNPTTHGQDGHKCDLQPHSFQVTAPHDPLGAPGTWCTEAEAEQAEAARQAQVEDQPQEP